MPFGLAAILAVFGLTKSGSGATRPPLSSLNSHGFILMDLQPWHYFLIIERDFVKTLDFVEFHTANEGTYSNEFAKLILLIGSEIDVVAKMLCKTINPDSRPRDIDDYRRIICNRFPNLHTVEIEVARYARNIKPWLSWDTAASDSPDWWKAYNKIKHQRDQHFSKANLKNTADALCGLLVLLLYHYKDVRHLQPYPELLNYGFSEYIVTEGSGRLPDN